MSGTTVRPAQSTRPPRCNRNRLQLVTDTVNFRTASSENCITAVDSVVAKLRSSSTRPHGKRRLQLASCYHVPMADDAWDPGQYARFCDERQAPFLDLAALVEAAPSMRILDLGCGTGELTALLHERLGARRTLGVDSSEKMLEAARARSVAGLELLRARIEELDLDDEFDLVLSNSVLHWLDDHTGLLTRFRRWLAPGGQLAVQMPDNFPHASHRVARAIAAEEPFASALGTLPSWPVLAPERYAELLEELGYARQHVRLQVYGHRLARAEDVVEWVKGSLLTTFRARLDAALYTRFLDTYRERLLGELGERAPFFYTYRRLIVWGRLPGGG